MLESNVCLEGKTVLVTGAAGFIGSSLVKRLLRDVKGIRIVGVDNLSAYYDVSLKQARLAEIETLAKGNPQCWTFRLGNIADRAALETVFKECAPSVVVNFAAQAGIHYSIENPDAYMESNVMGFYNILELCRRYPVDHLVFASSSSVYGDHSSFPFSTDDPADRPLSLYAATKRGNELMAHAYSKLYDIPSTGLRFFTVYGPWGRPDMAYFSFAEKLHEGESIRIFNYGLCQRDFTYIDDIVEGVLRVMQHAPERATGEDGLPVPPYRIYNIGNGHPETVLDFVTVLEEELTAASVLPPDFDPALHRELLPMQPGDVLATYADCTPLMEDFGFRPDTPLRDGMRAFARWYADVYLKMK